MNARPCPQCETGWLRADELPGAAGLPVGNRLIPCPSCLGSGQILGDDAPNEYHAPTLREGWATVHAAPS